MADLSDAARKLVQEHSERIVPSLLRDRLHAMKDELFADFLRRISDGDLYEEVADRLTRRVNHFGGSNRIPDYAQPDGSSLIGFVQLGTGAIPRTVQAKAREIVSVTDFYANGASGVAVDPTGVVDSTLGIQAAIDAAFIGADATSGNKVVLDDVFLTNVDTGLVTDQITQYCKFSTVTVQIANTGALLDSIGGANSIVSCDFGGNTTALDIASGTWDLSNVSAEALSVSTSYCLRLGRSGGVNTTVAAKGLYIEGLDASTISIQIEDSVTRTSLKGIHRHGTIGGIVNNAGDEVLIEVPGQGFYTPVYKTQRVEFSSTIDGSAQSSIRSNGGNTIELRNAANDGFADVFARAVIPATNTVTYSTSMTPDALAGRTQIITVSDGVAFTINAPANPVAGARITLLIRNGSGGAVGAITWNAIYKMSAWTSPANNFSRAISFEHQNTVWTQISQTGADIPL